MPVLLVILDVLWFHKIVRGAIKLIVKSKHAKVRHWQRGGERWGGPTGRKNSGAKAQRGPASATGMRRRLLRPLNAGDTLG